MEDFKNGMEGNLLYFHTNFILDFALGIYRKIHADSDNQKYAEVFIAANHLPTNYWDNSVMHIM